MAAEEAGIRPGDEVVEFAGQPVKEHSDFRTLVITAPSELEALIKRDEETIRLKVRLNGQRARFGFEWTHDRTEPDSIIVSNVLPGSPAELAGLKQKQRIVAIGGKAIGDQESFKQKLLDSPSPIAIDVEEHGRYRSLKMIRIEDPDVPKAEPDSPDETAEPGS